MEDIRHRSKVQEVLIVDDHPIVRRGLRELVDNQIGLRACAEAAEAYEALRAIEKHKPDLALVDIALKKMGGLELTKQIRSLYPNLPVLIISLHSEDIYARRALRAGASGYIMKSAADEEIIRAIRRIMEGGMYFSEEVTDRMLMELSGRGNVEGSSPLEVLSDRELEVFYLIGKGYPPRDIAEKLTLSVKTVETHRQRLKEKLDIPDATMLTRYAIQWYKTDAS